MLYSSVYNLFALVGRKAPFTHSLTEAAQTLIIYIELGDVILYILYKFTFSSNKYL